MKKNFLQFIKEKNENVIYQSDKDYETFLKMIKYLPESIKTNLIDKYLEQKKNGRNPQIETMIEK